MGHIWLIGMMGSGKTSVGLRLCHRLQIGFIDTDEAIEEVSGRTIADLFSDGENVFRAYEQNLIADISAMDGLVVATGGGAVLDPANVAAMRTSGTTILLDADPQTLRSRLTGSTDRPLLIDGGDIATIADARSAVYKTAADHVVDTAGKSIDEVADEVVRCAAM